MNSRSSPMTSPVSASLSIVAVPSMPVARTTPRATARPRCSRLGPVTRTERPPAARSSRGPPARWLTVSFVVRLVAAGAGPAQSTPITSFGSSGSTVTGSRSRRGRAGRGGSAARTPCVSPRRAARPGTVTDSADSSIWGWLLSNMPVWVRPVIVARPRMPREGCCWRRAAAAPHAEADREPGRDRSRPRITAVSTKPKPTSGWPRLPTTKAAASASSNSPSAKEPAVGVAPKMSSC